MSDPTSSSSFGVPPRVLEVFKGLPIASRVKIVAQMNGEYAGRVQNWTQPEKEPHLQLLFEASFVMHTADALRKRTNNASYAAGVAPLPSVADATIAMGEWVRQLVNKLDADEAWQRHLRYCSEARANRVDPQCAKCAGFHARHQ